MSIKANLFKKMLSAKKDKSAIGPSKATADEMMNKSSKKKSLFAKKK